MRQFATVLLTLTLAFGAAPVGAATGTSAITGISDASTLLLLEDATGRIEQTSAVTSFGQFEFVGIASGTYDIEMLDWTGRTLGTIDDITVGPDQTVQLNVMSDGTAAAGQQTAQQNNSKRRRALWYILGVGAVAGGTLAIVNARSADEPPPPLSATF